MKQVDGQIRRPWDAMSTIGKKLSWPASRVGVGAKQVDFYNVSTSLDGMKKLLTAVSFTSVKASERADTSQGGEVSDGKARSRTVPVFFALNHPPPPRRLTRPSSQAECRKGDFLRPRYFPASRTVPRCAVPDFGFGGKAFCRRRRTFLLTATWNGGS